MKENKVPVKETRNKYMREWRKRNPDKLSVINHRYWEKKAKQAAEKQSYSKEEA